MRFNPLRGAATLLGCVFALLLAPSAQATSVSAVTSDRSGSISASDAIGPPVQLGFALPLGDLSPTNFADCVQDAGRTACMNITSGFLGLGPGTHVDGFAASGTISAVKPAGPGHATAISFLSVGIQVSGVPAGQVVPFHFNGFLNEGLATAVITLTGPSTNMVINSTTTWDQTLSFANGTYTLSLTLDASLFTAAAGSKALGFSVNLQRVLQTPPVCGASPVSCAIAHGAPGCSDATCCSLVCNFDTFCCDNQWDFICAGESVTTCAVISVTDTVVNPTNGHRYVLASIGSLAELNGFAANASMHAATISDAKENQWIYETMALNVPGIVPHNVFIGLTDAANEGTFVWSDGEPFTFAHWMPGQPNNQPSGGSGDSDATILTANGGLWDDVPTTTESMGVVEVYESACGTGGSCFSPHGPGCSDESCCNDVCSVDGYCCDTSWDEQCVTEATSFCKTTMLLSVVNPATHSRYLLVSGAAWTQAERFAILVGGHLVTIDSAAENEWLRLNFLNIPGLPAGAWIGFNDAAVEGMFQWTDHRPVNFTNWSVGEPNNAGGAEDATILNANGTWNDAQGLSTAAAIVEIPCFADLDRDGAVGGSDLGILLGAWGSSGSAADLSGDLIVDGADLALFLGAWGPCQSSDACTARETPGSDQPGCTKCVCELDSFCCTVRWDSICVAEAQGVCVNACQCGG